MIGDPHIPILVYHQVTPGDPPANYPQTAVSRRAFEKQMHYLHTHGYQTISIETAAFPQAASSVPQKPVAITFDDGYRDCLTVAYPILAGYGFHAAVFLVTDFIGGIECWEKTHHTSAPLLSWDEIQALRAEGVCFGSHTRTHPRLIQQSPAQSDHEIAASKARLEAELGQPVRFLAYPYGESDAAIRAAARRAGYDAAFGVSTGPFDLFNIWRRAILRTDGLYNFAYKLSQQYRFMHWVRRWLREETRIGAYLRQIKHRRRA